MVFYFIKKYTIAAFILMSLWGCQGLIKESPEFTSSSGVSTDLSSIQTSFEIEKINEHAYSSTNKKVVNAPKKFIQFKFKAEAGKKYAVVLKKSSATLSKGSTLSTTAPSSHISCFGTGDISTDCNIVLGITTGDFQTVD